MGYSLFKDDGRFSKCSHFFNIECFSGAAFCTEQLKNTCRMDFDMFFGILIFEPK